MEFKFDEFEESDVVFSDYSSDQSSGSENGGQRRGHFGHFHGTKMVHKRKKSLNKKSRVRSSSMPVNIPGMMMSSSRYDDNDEFDDVASFELFDEDQMVRMPPHMIVERRRVNEEIMARSFSPLKGKDLCQFRNSILRMTGFLEG